MHSPETSSMSDVSPNYSQYKAISEFICHKVVTRQGFKGKKYPHLILVIASINDGKEEPFVTEIHEHDAYTYRIHVDRLYHEYDLLDTPEGGWPDWISFH